VLLKVNTDGSRVRLRDVARLGLGAESYSVHNNEYDGDPATGLAVKLATGANATLESIAAVTSERGFSFAYAAVPLSYPLHEAFNFDAQAQRSLF